MPGTSQTRRCFILDDSPSDTDAFGSHERIAAAIKELVRTEQGGKAIALVGRWGSGKSTIVNLLSPGPTPEKGQAGCDANEPMVFVFDTWAHEGDPLRRTFLEQLIVFFVEKGCAPKDKWVSKLSELSGRRKQATTTTTPNLTGLGIIFALFLYLAAIGLAVLRLDSIAPISFWAAIFFCLAPLLVLLIAKLVLKKTDDAGFNLFGLLLNKTKETTTTETLESVEPTSVEFEAWFKELISEAVPSNRKLLITIDNLDRVDVGDAKKLWSSVRTFLDFCGRDMPSWASNVWVLIPYDRSGIKRLWNDEEDGPITQAFLEKSFQTCFDVPAPLISDWRTFLQRQLKKAFPDHAEDDF
jgi:energy-coupling factor transporter ATP-binding protein EcfA2